MLKIFRPLAAAALVMAAPALATPNVFWAFGFGFPAGYNGPNRTTEPRSNAVSAVPQPGASLTALNSTGLPAQRGEQLASADGVRLSYLGISDAWGDCALAGQRLKRLC